MLPYPLDLTPGDFDAYLAERATSNAFSRPRLEFKQRALAWARHVGERLHSLDIDTDCYGSDEHPSVRNGHRVDCQWVFFWRSAAKRAELDALIDQRAGIAAALRDPSPFYRHAFLALRLDSDKIEVCAQVHPDAWADFESLVARLADDDRAAIIAQTISALPEQFRFGISGQPVQPTATISAGVLRDTVTRVRDEGAALWVGWSVPRDLALDHAETLDEQLEDALIALAPVYQQMAWREDDDPAGLLQKLSAMRAQMAEAAAQRAEQERRVHEEKARVREEQTERSRERTRERVEYDANRPRPTLADLFKPAVPAEASRPEPKVSQTPAAPKPAASRKLPAPPAAMPHGRSADHPPKPREPKEAPVSDAPRPRRPSLPPPTYVAGGTVDKSAKVRVLSGPFAGKVGVVGELDGRGGARVLLGLLSTRLLVDQLEAVVEAGDRPSLQSSHRRNGLLGRSGK